jgi:superoxide dismutase, Fe-Mn family
MPPSLETALLRDYSSIDNLKTQFLANAKAMFGPGFIWLVYTTNKYEVGTLRRFFILRTYLGGSPLAGAHFRRQEQDMNSSNSRSYARSLGQRAADGLVEVTPVLCVSTWQHSWMFDWTVAGKEQFLEAWWNKINWKVVSDLADIDRVERSSQADTERKRRETMGLSGGLFDN